MKVLNKALNGYYRLKRSMVRKFYKSFKLSLSSDPYLSGDSFKLLADHQLDSNTIHSFQPEKVLENEVIFLASDLIDTFIHQFQQKISKNFILITGNGDRNIGEIEIAQVSPFCKKWFAQNVVVRHDKLHPLPIGLENANYQWHGVTSEFDKFRKRTSQKAISKIAYGFTVQNNPTERTYALDILSALPYSEKLTPGNPFFYKKQIIQYQFVASPPGNGLDCHRTWEAMYLGVVPIVKRSVGMETFRDLGLPIEIIDDWKELTGWSEEILRNKYEKHQMGFSNPSLWFPYWKKMIEGYR